jgi:hypothetical protein
MFPLNSLENRTRQIPHNVLVMALLRNNGCVFFQTENGGRFYRISYVGQIPFAIEKSGETELANADVAD